MDIKVKLKINLLGKTVLLIGTGAITELHTLVPAIVAIKKK